MLHCIALENRSIQYSIDSIAVSVFVDFLTLANTETAVATPLERM